VKSTMDYERERSREGKMRGWEARKRGDEESHAEVGNRSPP